MSPCVRAATRALLTLVWALSVCPPGQAAPAAPRGRDIVIPAAGNAYLTSDEGDDVVSAQGVRGWKGPASIRFYFRAEAPGPLVLGLRGRLRAGSGTVRANVGAESFDIGLPLDAMSTVPIGTISVARPGYVCVELWLDARGADTLVDIDALTVRTPSSNPSLAFVKPSDDATYGRRGAQVTLWYDMPRGNQEWLYSEVTVPVGQDRPGTYYETNGCGQAYFGIQVNSPTERRILFSVWSPFETDNPGAVPERSRVLLVKKGEGVHIGAFGNEGSGGQSYLVYPWKAGVSYRFLTRVHPVENDAWGQPCTEYTSWFGDPNAGAWRLIACWRRPATSTWITGPYAFLENFYPREGWRSRMALYGNQWCRDQAGRWREMTSALVSPDATGRSQARRDFTASVRGRCFVLEAFGFIDRTIVPDTRLTRQPNGGRGPLTEAELRSLLR